MRFSNDQTNPGDGNKTDLGGIGWAAKRTDSDRETKQKENRNRRNKTEMKGGENLRLNYNGLQMRIITEEIHSTSKSS